MAEGNILINRFNRGEIAPQALARIDLERLADSAETMLNVMPIRLGAMSLRSGTQYLGDVPSQTYGIPFVKATDDTAIIDFSDNVVRFWIDDEPVTRVANAAVIADGDFASLTGWTNQSETGASALAVDGSLRLLGTGFAEGAVHQDVTATGELSIRLEVSRAAVHLELGTTTGGHEIYSGELEVGTHSLKVTVDTTTLSIRLSNINDYRAEVEYIEIEDAGVMELPTGYTTADLPYIRATQSADKIFLACKNKAQKVIERRGRTSWSIVDYRPFIAPFGIVNTSQTTMSVAAISGDTQLTASRNFFEPEHVGASFKLFNSGQTVVEDFSGDAQFTDSIRVSGVSLQEGDRANSFVASTSNSFNNRTGLAALGHDDADSTRDFSVSITGSWIGSVYLQRSIGGEGDWEDVGEYYTRTNVIIDDQLDNQIVYYRLATKDNFSGTAKARLVYTGGTSDGIARVTSYVSPTVVNVQVLNNFGSTSETSDWYESQWSEHRGYPSAVGLYEGRLFWAGKNNIWGSVSDSYYSYSLDIEGDSAAIIRSIGYGAVDTINWLLPMSRLIMGTTGSEVSARSSSFDEPLTATNFNLKDTSTQGSNHIDVVKSDTSGFFVQRSGTRLFELAYSYENNSYTSQDVMLLHPDIAKVGIRRVAVQRQPDTRIHILLNDGTVVIYLFDPAEGVSGLIRWTTDGDVVDAVVLPEANEDAVYYTVLRDGVYMREKWARAEDCRGGSLSNHKDSFVNAASGLEHLEGRTVSAWVDGKEAGEFVVTAGAIDVTGTNITVGLPYVGQYKTGKLAYAAVKGTAINQRKRIMSLGFVLRDVYPDGFRFGSDFDDDLLLSLPLEDAEPDETLASYDEVQIPFDDTHGSDSRICLEISSPATVMAMIPQIKTLDR